MAKITNHEAWTFHGKTSQLRDNSSDIINGPRDICEAEHNPVNEIFHHHWTLLPPMKILTRIDCITTDIMCIERT